jgi:two-component system response regulator
MSKPKFVLVADDSIDDFLVVKRGFSLEQLPHRLHHLEDGEQTLAYLRGDPPFADRETWPFPDLLILDAKMPGMNGFEVLAALKNGLGIQLPVVMLSGSILRKDKEAAFSLGANEYLTKPTELADLRSLVQKMHSRWLSQP